MFLLLYPIVPSRVLLVFRPALGPLAVAVVDHAPQRGHHGAPLLVRLQLLLLQR